MSITSVVETFVFLFYCNVANRFNSCITVVDDLPFFSIFSFENGREKVPHDFARPKTLSRNLRIGQTASTYM